MTGESWNGFISINGASPGPVPSYFLSVSPGWLKGMKIPVLEDRDFEPKDTAPGVAIINKTLAKRYWGVDDPLGKSLEIVAEEGQRFPYRETIDEA